ncbi:MAG TPA: DUF3108 domain-containing protein [Pyrinomonadaceae bacterium]|nr:DUF3108 domain-containing protein [Pyrinomonadaceae bacterium]
MFARSLRLASGPKRPYLFLTATACLCLFAVSLAISWPVGAKSEQGFRVGEKITYTVSFEKFSNVAFAEMHTVSRGKIGEIEAVELRGRVKTLELMSAAFYLVDESRVVFASPDSGLPLYVTKTQHVGGLPRDYVQNFLSTPTSNYDLLTTIYRLRQSDGSGTFNIFDGDRIYPLMFQAVGNEKVRTEAGEFETSIHTVQSEYFTELGIRDLRINLSTDEAKIPVLIRFRTSKGAFRASVNSIQNLEPAPEPAPTIVPVATPTPTPAPSPTPIAYIDNQPLGLDLSFVLGETLDYSLTAGDQAIGSFTLQAVERKQFLNNDSLLLVATITDATPENGLMAKGDSAKAWVDPATLGPKRLEMTFSGSLAALSKAVEFDERTNTISFGGTNRVDAPAGTHNILSLIYAMRSFNLKPSLDASNPINDTRVAVFWDTRPYIFTLRPSQPEVITSRGERVSAQMISISTGNRELDQLSIKVWLSNDVRRVPLRFSIGRFQANLVGDRIVSPR